MTEPDETGGAPRGVARAWGWLVDGLAAAGTVMIGALMLLISADVVARNLLGSSLPLVSELGALVLVMIVYLQLAATVRADRLARTEIFFAGFCRARPRAGAVLSAAFDAAGAAAVGGIAWATVGILGKDLDFLGEFIGVPGIATAPVWPFRVLILLGVTVAAVEFALRVRAALGAARRGGAA